MAPNHVLRRSEGHAVELIRDRNLQIDFSGGFSRGSCRKCFYEKTSVFQRRCDRSHGQLAVEIDAGDDQVFLRTSVELPDFQLVDRTGGDWSFCGSAARR